MPVYNICDFSKLDEIGVVCRGASLGKISKYKEYFKNCFIVGQHLESFKKIGKHFCDSNIVKVHGSVYTKYKKHNRRMDREYGIIDMQTYLDPTLSDRKAYKFKKIYKKNKWMKVYARPINFLERNKKFTLLRILGEKRDTHPTLGLYGVDLAAAYNPKNIHIIGLDFYDTPDYVIERMHVPQERNKPKLKGMLEYLNLLCREEKKIQFYLYTSCRQVKSHDNLKVIKV